MKKESLDVNIFELIDSGIYNKYLSNKLNGMSLIKIINAILGLF